MCLGNSKDGVTSFCEYIMTPSSSMNELKFEEYLKGLQPLKIMSMDSFDSEFNFSIFFLNYLGFLLKFRIFGLFKSLAVSVQFALLFITFVALGITKCLH